MIYSIHSFYSLHSLHSFYFLFAHFYFFRAKRKKAIPYRSKQYKDPIMAENDYNPTLRSNIITHQPYNPIQDIERINMIHENNRIDRINLINRENPIIFSRETILVRQAPNTRRIIIEEEKEEKEEEKDRYDRTPPSAPLKNIQNNYSPYNLDRYEIQNDHHYNNKNNHKNGGINSNHDNVEIIHDNSNNNMISEAYVIVPENPHAYDYNSQALIRQNKEAFSYNPRYV